MYFKNGPSLPMDEQLYRRCQYETFHIVLDVHLGVFRVFAVSTRIQLLLLLFRSVHLHAGLVAARAIHDGSWYRDVPLYIVHADERSLWNHDWNRHHRPSQEEGVKHHAYFRRRIYSTNRYFWHWTVLDVVATGGPLV